MTGVAERSERKKREKHWTFTAGQKGSAHRVTVFENIQRDGVLTLRWLEDGKRRTESLGRALRTAEGKIVKESERWAKAEAQRRYEALVRGERSSLAPLPVAPLTIGETKAKLTDPHTGKYATPTAHRRETLRALDFACKTWGSARAWDTIGKAELRALGRARIQQLRAAGQTGLAGAEHTVQRILTIAQWLRDEELIDAGACVPTKAWKDELRGYWLETTEEHQLPEPDRPRHTIDEAKRITLAAHDVDPRLELMLCLASNQRLGQVRRVHRSNVDLEASDLQIPTRGRKRGARILMTAFERAHLDLALTVGYLRLLEAAYRRGEIKDYPFFPQGQLPGSRTARGLLPNRPGLRDPARPFARDYRTPETPTATVERHATAKPVGQRAILGWFDRAEAKAGVAKVEGRGPYGVRRAFVDAGKELKISREGLTALGGWADPQMADRIYADEEARYALQEARDVRARIRGEDSTVFPANPTQPHSSECKENETNNQQPTNNEVGADDVVGRSSADVE